MNEIMGDNEIYTIEGNIAAGKSTLGIDLASTGLVGYIPEPVAIWQNRYEDNILSLFYSDQDRWSFMFQMAAFTTRAKTWSDVLKLLDHSRVFLDRSVYSDRYIFARSLNKEGVMTNTEYQVYVDMWEWMVENWCVTPEKIIYVKTSPKECLERLKERARDEELQITLSYLQDLHEMHEEWLDGRNDVITLDGSKPINVTTLLKKLNIS